MTESVTTAVLQAETASQKLVLRHQQQKQSPSDVPSVEESSGSASVTPLPLIEQEFPVRIVWRNVGLFLYLHAAALVGLYFLLMGHVMWQTMVWGKKYSNKLLYHMYVSIPQELVRCGCTLCT